MDTLAKTLNSELKTKDIQQVAKKFNLTPISRLNNKERSWYRSPSGRYIIVQDNKFR